MYTRSYSEESPRQLPEGYSGTMLDAEEPHEEPREERQEQDAAPVFGWLSGLGGGISSLFGKSEIGNLKLGTEELLIAGVALFLLFSKNGDKECAIMFLLALFIAK